MELVVSGFGGNVMSVEGGIKKYDYTPPVVETMEWGDHSLPVSQSWGTLNITFLCGLGDAGTKKELTWFLELGDLYFWVYRGELRSTEMAYQDYITCQIDFLVKGAFKTYEELCAAVMRERIEESI